MSYTPTEWQDRIVEKPRTYHVQNNPDGTITLIPAPGTVVQEGTPVNAANLNKLEQGLVTHQGEKATDEDLGHVKQGSRITIDGNGVISADIQANIAAGSYIGNGTSGRTVNVGFAPKLVVVTRSDGIGQYISTSSSRNTTHQYHTTTSWVHVGSTTLRLTEDGFVLGGAGIAYDSANETNVVYTYVAIA